VWGRHSADALTATTAVGANRRHSAGTAPSATKTALTIRLPANASGESSCSQVVSWPRVTNADVSSTSPSEGFGRALVTAQRYGA
jgi:hypothetical protein